MVNDPTHQSTSAAAKSDTNAHLPSTRPVETAAAAEDVLWQIYASEDDTSVTLTASPGVTVVVNWFDELNRLLAAPAAQRGLAHHLPRRDEEVRLDARGQPHFTWPMIT